MRSPNAPAREAITRRRLPDPLPRVLREAREAAGLSQREAAKRARISQPFLAQLEGGKRGFSRKTAKTLAAVLDLDGRDRRRLEAASRPLRVKREWTLTPKRVSWRAYRAAELVGRKAMARIDRASGRRGKGGRPMRRQRFTRR